MDENAKELNNNQQNRDSIILKIRQLILKVALFSMIAIGVASIILMFTMRRHGEDYIVRTLEYNVMNKLEDTSIYVEDKLKRFESQAIQSADYIYDLYVEPEKYLPRKIEEHTHFEEDQYCYRLFFASEDYKNSSKTSDLDLLNNVLSLWIPLLNSDEKIITSIYYGTEDGYFISMDCKEILGAEKDNFEYFNFFNRDWYQRAKEKKNVLFTDVSLDYFGAGIMITCAAPVIVNGEFKGVVAIDILASNLQQSITEIDVEEGAEVFAIDGKGNIIDNPKMDQPTKLFDNIYDTDMRNVADTVLSRESGIKRDNNMYYVYAPINNIDWMICARVPRSIVNTTIKSFDRNIRRMMATFFVVAFLVLFVVFFVAQSFSEKLTNPIERLTDDVKIISSGNLDYKAKIDGNDEISELARSFNAMTSSLKQYIVDVTNLVSEREREGVELQVASSIQESMLPTKFPAFPDDKRFEIYATMHAAKEVGGDFYDFFKIDDNHLALVVADVSGKGIPAALFMAIGKTLIKDHSYIQSDLAEIFYIVNHILCESNKENLFITAFEAIINLETGEMLYVNAGHELPFIYRKNNDKWEAFNIPSGFVLAGMDEIQYTTGSIKFEKGDKLFQYTDGVTEATNTHNELYGMDRLEKVLNANVDKSVTDLLPNIREDISKFVGEAPQFDDITMLAFEYK